MIALPRRVFAMGRPVPAWNGIICPQGRIEPQHLGQFFYDKQNEVFYRVAGLTEHDWQLVTPAEMPGFMIKSFVDFLEPVHHAQAGTKEYAAAARAADAAKEDRQPWIVDENAMAGAGLRIADARTWMTASGVRVAQARLKIEAKPRAAVFAGFVAAGPASPVLMPAHAEGEAAIRVEDRLAAGFLFDDTAGNVLFAVAGGTVAATSYAPIRAWHVSLRIEIGGPGPVEFWADDELIAELPSHPIPGGVEPRVSLFDYGDGR